jgi:ABC-2 type transport system ATP-binding protein
VVRTARLTKAYGPQPALQGVDLAVPAGSLYGLVGPNGSGKTTLLEILAGLRRPSGGELHLGVAREAVAYCPDVAEFEPWLRALEVLEVALGLLGRCRPRAELEDVLQRVGLAEVANRKVGGFSRGMTTRLNLAAGLVGQPALFLVDEPASALDPAGRVDILRLVASLAPTTTVVLSSHDLSEVEAICDQVGILASGRLLYQGPLGDLLAGSARPRWLLVVRPPANQTLAALSAASWISSVNELAPGELELTSADPGEIEIRLPGLLAACGARLVSVSPVRPSLEDIFLALTAAPAERGAEV